MKVLLKINKAAKFVGDLWKFNVRYGSSKSRKARFRCRSTHVPNLTDELSTAKERRLNQFGTAVLVWCGKSVKFDRVCRAFVELNIGSTHGVPSESDVPTVSLPSSTYAIKYGDLYGGWVGSCPPSYKRL